MTLPIQQPAAETPPLLAQHRAAPPARINQRQRGEGNAQPRQCLELDRLGPYTSVMHTVREKQKLLARVRRMKGQIEAIERALEHEAGCEQVLHLIAGVRGAMAGLMAEVVEDHVRSHLVDADQHPGALKQDAVEQLLDVVRSYLK